ncbi:PadR family transcriptional regulator [Agromyces tardus]|uniref:PadR family transcriptional regulator n=1 Tax=Agromyces tardus TaxID=2583849 RepID=A0A3M8AI73_9MICO|nr:helix-turn-helix transcriptional regulator [Agromyces tardus]RNB50858.1 PadR family transcriptional regulator [Agromyces tardus]
MAVRDALLALLTTGPAYGFQLHGGLAERTGGRRTVNVGQTYATLERLAKQRLVEPAGATDDGLPLHRLTAAGEAAAQAWLAGADAAGADPWDETVDRVLVALSLPGIDAASIIDAEGAKWRERQSAVGASAAASEGPADSAHRGLVDLASAAEAARARAALDWLAAVAAVDESALSFAPSGTRPKRGRRPSAAPAA